MTRFDRPNFIPAIEKLLVTTMSKETTTLFWVLITSPAVPLPPSVTLSCAISGRLIEDYHLIVESHERAVDGGGYEASIQAIDMGRRGLHNEGAELLSERLAGRVGLDFETARRLFTLICALHQRI